MKSVAMGGRVKTRVVRASGPGFMWKASNFPRMVIPWVKIQVAHILGIPTLEGRLWARLLRADGRVINYGLVSNKVVTTAFVEYMVDEMIAETTAWGDFKFHDSGVGDTAAVIGDTDIETTDNVARTSGTQLEGATGEIYKSVGTITYGGALAITEHGLFNILTGGILLDRSVFSIINVGNGDSIEFTYELTVDDGG